MSIISLITAIMVTLLMALPTTQADMTTSIISKLPEGIGSITDTTSSGTITTCSEPDFLGSCTAVDVLNKCSNNFASGAIKSLTQDQGAVCTYYRDTGCAAGNHSPSKRVDSGAGVFEWRDMGEWAGKVLSFKCGGGGGA
ncbi:unnamed protein product [Periconia digitata]|uniref:Uncharacterized protein n=1 Tax=Periconia digitata TaxID=1303443 RepID=A0A9W4XVU3_9PLEO|nr:unnamed protein product [Periconia digitata]